MGGGELPQRAHAGARTICRRAKRGAALGPGSVRRTQQAGQRPGANARVAGAPGSDAGAGRTRGSVPPGSVRAVVSASSLPLFQGTVLGGGSLLASQLLQRSTFSAAPG